jgi:hypothetical protein
MMCESPRWTDFVLPVIKGVKDAAHGDSSLPKKRNLRTRRGASVVSADACLAHQGRITLRSAPSRR